MLFLFHIKCMILYHFCDCGYVNAYSFIVFLFKFLLLSVLIFSGWKQLLVFITIYLYNVIYHILPVSNLHTSYEGFNMLLFVVFFIFYILIFSACDYFLF